MIDRLSRVSGVNVPRETFEELEAFAALISDEARNQNLVAASTIVDLWERHLFDSAQLIRLGRAGNWVDIGSGAGLPGVVIALITGASVTLVEPRRLRAEFLCKVKSLLQLDNVTVVQAKSASVGGKFDNITARAVAPSSELLAITIHLSHSKTMWVLPKGRSAQKELDDVRAAWQGEFRLEPSLTDPQASILLATRIRSRGTR